MRPDKEQSYVLIGIASSGHTRQWGYENHKLIIDHLIKKNYKKFCLLSGKDQADLESKLIKKFSSEEIFIEGTSNLSLKNIFEKAKKGKFYFGHDTGFMYLSSSLNIPAIGLFGEVSPYFYSDNMKSIVPEDEIFGENCIKNISFENAKSKLDKFISLYKL
jgi:ADP-heptose:LPS heptosyltransferase